MRPPREKLPRSRSAKKKVLVEVSDRGTLTLPKEFRGTGLFEVRVLEDGTVALIPQATVAASSAWFWTQRWQEMEREADSDVAAGRVTRYESGEAFLADLEQL